MRCDRLSKCGVETEAEAMWHKGMEVYENSHEEDGVKDPIMQARLLVCPVPSLQVVSVEFPTSSEAQIVEK